MSGQQVEVPPSEAHSPMEVASQVEGHKKPHTNSNGGDNQEESGADGSYPELAKPDNNATTGDIEKDKLDSLPVDSITKPVTQTGSDKPVIDLPNKLVQESSSSPDKLVSQTGLSVEDEPMETGEEVEGEEQDEEEGVAKSGPTRKGKLHQRSPQYLSIIRTRRTSGMQQQLVGDKKLGKEESVAVKPAPPTIEEGSGEEDMGGDMKERRGSKGRGRGAGSSGLKRNKSVEKEEVGSKSGRGRGKIALVTRAAAAGMKEPVRFHQLPGRPKRQKTQEEEWEEDVEQPPLPAAKKSKLDRESSKEDNNGDGDSHKDDSLATPSEGGTKGVKNSPRVKSGRGRNRRGRGGKTEDDAIEETANKKPKKEPEQEGEESSKMGVAEKPEQQPVKKKRGRPKKRSKEALQVSMDTSTSEGKGEEGGDDPDTSCEMTEPVKGTRQIKQLLELSEDINSGKMEGGGSCPDGEHPTEDAPVDTPSEEGVDKVSSPQSNKGSDVTSSENVPDNASKTTPTETTNDKSSSPKPEDNSSSNEKSVTATPKQKESPNTENIAKEGGNPNDPHPPNAPPTDTPTGPQGSTAAPVEPTYPFPTHRFASLEEQGYHPFSHIPPPFLTGYPPFSSHPYPGAFMLPTSPHFPHPYPPECIPPEMFPRFPEDFARYPIPPLPTTTSISNSQAESSVSNVGTITNSSSPTPSSSIATCIPMPLPLSQAYPGYTLPSPYGPPPTIMGPHPSLIPTGDWNMGPPPQGPPTQPAPPPQLTPPTQQASATPVVPAPKSTKESRFPLSLLPTDDSTTTVSQPVDCPECGRHFKNNKALNGHMRLHGGFDWTRRPYQVMQSRQQQQLAKEAERRAAASTSTSNSTDQVDHSTTTTTTTATTTNGASGDHHKKGGKGNKQQHAIKNGLKGSSAQFSPPESRHSGTLDDLCRAAEELERIERNGFKSKPTPLILPHEKRMQSFSPPYTPPPILSPARSLMMLSNSAERLSGGNNSGSGANSAPLSTIDLANCSSDGISTPSKIWPQRKVSEQRPLDHEEQQLLEPKINIGPEFQADLPSYQDIKEGAVPKTPPRNPSTLVWQPLEGLLQQDEDTIDGFLELSCSPAVPNGGRNKELALHLLHQVKGSVKEAVRLMVMGRTMVVPDDEMANYNFTGSKKWSSRERQQFRRAWRTHRKQFQLIQNQVDTKSLPELVEYYYSWKKYCPDEYRGRNRHHSEEVLSDEDGDIYLHPSSVASTSSGSNDTDNLVGGDNETTPTQSLPKQAPPKESKPSPSGKQKTTPSKGGLPSEIMDHLPRHFLSNQSSFGGSVQEYRCKYPGCNQVYTSIFALNGHIRVHGGSWYPKKPDVEHMQSFSHGSHAHSQGGPHPSNQGSHPAFPLSKLKKEKEEEEKLRHQLEIAKTMVMDLPQPRSPAQSMIRHTPSPRPSPGGHGKSSLIRSKKVSSASPSDREGHYPCNRCGRIFPKVKSRSAHMKSHIVKPVTKH